jgi:hypothetical protein
MNLNRQPRADRTAHGRDHSHIDREYDVTKRLAMVALLIAVGAASGCSADDQSDATSAVAGDSGTGSDTASGTAGEDAAAEPCDLLSEAEAEKFAKASLERSEQSGGDICLYQGDDASSALNSVSVTMHADASPENVKEAATAGGTMKAKPVAALGENSYYTPELGTVAFLKGSTMYGIRIALENGDPAKASLAAAKLVASRVK